MHFDAGPQPSMNTICSLFISLLYHEQINAYLLYVSTVMAVGHREKPL